MRTIYKMLFDPNAGNPVKVHLPRGAKILHVHDQNSCVGIWFELNEGESLRTEDRTFFIVGTGHPIPSHCEYLGTAHCGEFVWHLYEVMP